jgi:hypothetical protein
MLKTKMIDDTPQVARTSSLINRAEFRRRLIQHAQDERYYWRTIKNPRVSEARLQDAEAVMSAWIRSTVAGLPSKGKTI